MACRVWLPLEDFLFPNSTFALWPRVAIRIKTRPFTSLDSRSYSHGASSFLPLLLEKFLAVPIDAKSGTGLNFRFDFHGGHSFQERFVGHQAFSRPGQESRPGRRRPLLWFSPSSSEPPFRRWCRASVVSYFAVFLAAFAPLREMPRRNRSHAKTPRREDPQSQIKTVPVHLAAYGFGPPFGSMKPP